MCFLGVRDRPAVFNLGLRESAIRHWQSVSDVSNYYLNIHASLNLLLSANCNTGAILLSL